MAPQGTIRARVGKVRADNPGFNSTWDLLAAEEPLEIRLGFDDARRRRSRPVAVTMRTPGNDQELAIGFLLSERIITSMGQVDGILSETSTNDGPRFGESIRVDLRPGVGVDPSRLERNFAATSSCGVCGKGSLRALGLDGCATLTNVGPVVNPATLHGLPAALRGAQSLFESTGGLHAAALFGADGTLLAVREDVGRHNTVDKLLGARALERLDLPPHSAGPHGLFVSGRIGFEIVQKSLAGGIALIAAVGAPTSLAVEVAERFGQTLIGFVSDERFNVYTGPCRLRLSEPGSGMRTA